jgi:ABC transporter fused permease/ATP-binding protein
VMIAVVAVLALASASRFYLVMTIGERIVADLRRDVFAHLMSLSPAFFDSARSGELISRLTADTTQIKSAVGASVSVALRNLMLFIGATAMMVITSPRLSGFVLLAIPVIVIPLVAFGRWVRRLSRSAQDTLAEATAYASELVGAIRTVQAYTSEALANARFGGEVEQAYEAARSSTRARAVLTAIIIFIVFSSVVAILWIGSHDVLTGAITPGRLGQFVLYAAFAAAGLGQLSEVWGEVSAASGAAERLFEILRVKSMIAAPASPRAMAAPARGDVSFDNVGFAYPTRPDTLAVDGVTLAVRAGEKVAIVGPSGAGKSTLFHLLLRFYDPLSGAISFDGVPIREADPRQLRARIALVPQESVVFAASARDNIRFGRPDATDSEVERAADLAHASEFIRRLPGGFESQLGERGVTLSGGHAEIVLELGAELSHHAGEGIGDDVLEDAQGGSQLVGDGGDELALEAVVFPQDFVGSHQFELGELDLGEVMGIEIDIVGFVDGGKGDGEHAIADRDFQVFVDSGNADALNEFEDIGRHRLSDPASPEVQEDLAGLVGIEDLSGGIDPKDGTGIFRGKAGELFDLLLDAAIVGHIEHQAVPEGVSGSQSFGASDGPKGAFLVVPGSAAGPFQGDQSSGGLGQEPVQFGAIGGVEASEENLRIFAELAGLESEHGPAVIADEIEDQRAVGFQDPLKDQAGGVGHHAFVAGAGFIQRLLHFPAIGDILDEAFASGQQSLFITMDNNGITNPADRTVRAANLEIEGPRLFALKPFLKFLPRGQPIFRQDHGGPAGIVLGQFVCGISGHGQAPPAAGVGPGLALFEMNHIGKTGQPKVVIEIPQRLGQGLLEDFRGTGLIEKSEDQAVVDGLDGDIEIGKSGQDDADAVGIAEGGQLEKLQAVESLHAKVGNHHGKRTLGFDEFQGPDRVLAGFDVKFPAELPLESRENIRIIIDKQDSTRPIIRHGRVPRQEPLCGFAASPPSGR